MPGETSQPMAAAFSRLQTAISMNEKLSSILPEKLAPVLTPSNDEGRLLSEARRTEPPLAPLVQAITAMAIATEQSNARLESTLGRIAV